ncbi:hypothetical protein [Flavobacterium collinsii]|uniref:S9 family peptidase n=1 Tax=Flavobacterium collinsii TaxID=1114861 RepID=A0A9W4XD97_9FLAO|nr:hypothetical protein [Flavobacterium collinsii]CAA9195046.1 hypothetical protein FLACOL7796_00412 [Flavobacterium collinsii]CAI2765901.1 conserved exported protein of unknown function [Flavobacterium collinsii]
MKKLLLFLLLTYQSALLSQTILASYPLDLKRYDQNNNILNVENKTTNDVFVFVTNTQNLTILRYNSALFLKDEFTLSRTNLENRSIIGYSFSEDGNPSLYWASEDSSDILVVKYYLETKTYKILKFQYPSSSEYIVAKFQSNNQFYLLSKDVSQNTLTAYVFKNGMVEERIFDFSTFTFQNRKTQPLSFSQIIRENPIIKIDPDDYTPLDKASKKSKIYIENNHFILAFDHNPKETQLFDLNLDNQDVIEKKITQSETKTPRKISNSFYYEKKLYQINANEDELLLDIKNYDSGELIKNIRITKEDTIRFKTSPLFVQQGGERKPRELKNTKRFLQHLSALEIGLSVYENGTSTSMTLGGTPRVGGAYYTVMNDTFTWDYLPVVNDETVFFETALDQKSEFTSKDPAPMALDNLYYYLNTNKKATLGNVLKFSDYYILGYYDTASKQYTMRKFTDGFPDDQMQNPIIDKATFSKPFSFEKP